MEMISAMVYQLTRSLCMDEIKSSGFDAYFVDHTNGVYPVAASGIPFKMDYVASKGDIITDLHEDLAADGAIAQGQQSANKRRSGPRRVLANRRFDPKTTEGLHQSDAGLRILALYLDVRF